MGIVTVKLHYTDAKVCKNYLCGTCPHIVFTNTVSAYLPVASELMVSFPRARIRDHLGSTRLHDMTLSKLTTNPSTLRL